MPRAPRRCGLCSLTAVGCGQPAVSSPNTGLDALSRPPSCSDAVSNLHGRADSRPRAQADVIAAAAQNAHRDPAALQVRSPLPNPPRPLSNSPLHRPLSNSPLSHPLPTPAPSPHSPALLHSHYPLPRKFPPRPAADDPAVPPPALSRAPRLQCVFPCVASSVRGPQVVCLQEAWSWHLGACTHSQLLVPIRRALRSKRVNHRMRKTQRERTAPRDPAQIL